MASKQSPRTVYAILARSLAAGRISCQPHHIQGRRNRQTSRRCRTRGTRAAGRLGRSKCRRGPSSNPIPHAAALARGDCGVRLLFEEHEVARLTTGTLRRLCAWRFRRAGSVDARLKKGKHLAQGFAAASSLATTATSQASSTRQRAAADASANACRLKFFGGSAARSTQTRRQHLTAQPVPSLKRHSQTIQLASPVDTSIRYSRYLTTAREWMREDSTDTRALRVAQLRRTPCAVRLFTSCAVQARAQDVAARGVVTPWSLQIVLAALSSQLLLLPLLHGHKPHRSSFTPGSPTLAPPRSPLVLNLLRCSTIVHIRNSRRGLSISKLSGPTRTRQFLL